MRITLKTVLAVLLVTAGIGGVVAANTYDSTNTDDGTAAVARHGGFAPDRAPDHDVDLAKAERLLAEFDLDDETEAEILDELSTMVGDGASRADVNHALHYLLYQEGFDAEDVRQEILSARLDHQFDELDGEEADEVAAGVFEHRAGGASRAEIREYVFETLVDFGVPEAEVKRAFAQHRFKTAADHNHLTDDQRAELREGIRDLREDGATREEVREYIREKMDEFREENRADDANTDADADDADDADESDE